APGEVKPPPPLAAFAMVRGFLSSSYHPGQWLLSGSQATPVHWCRWWHSINNETPNMALGDRAPECRFHRQFPHSETKPFDLWAAGRTKNVVEFKTAAAKRWRSRSRSLKQRGGVG